MSSKAFKDLESARVAVIGLGYVGLPLAVEFGKKNATIGFDIDVERVAQLNAGHDRTLEVSDEELAASERIAFTADADEIKDCDVYIVTVPTPIDRSKRPDLGPLRSASNLVAEVISSGNIVIFESTVYPGCTEEVCVPIIEAASSLVYNSDFYAGYSPERINPGDKQHRLPDILKVTSGSNSDVAEYVDALYRRIIVAGTHPASSIRVAEAAKVIENTQRDLNIALVNELAIIFNRLGIDTRDVLEAAGTKWNFLKFSPGLVGGHCISVDPYYLTHKAQEIGYHPEVILSGRRINDSMGQYVADSISRLMTKKRLNVVDARVLVLGLAFKENCPDLRNTRVIDIVDRFRESHMQVDVYDPWVDATQAEAEYGIAPVSSLQEGGYDAVVLAVAHREFVEMGAAKLHVLGKENHVLYDVKGVLDPAEVDARL